MTLVSVIIPFLNAERFIQEAIESVFAQTYQQWELLLVDDGSTDASTTLARHWAEQYPERVRYLEHANHQNCGKTVSRNLGIRHARGEYVGFLDADDVWMPRKLEQQIAIFESHPDAGMVYGLSQWWYGWTGAAQDQARDFVHELGVEPNKSFAPRALFEDFFLRQKASLPNPSNALLRSETIAKVGGFDDEFRGMYDVYEDQAFIAKVSLGAHVFVSNECWDKYRQHSDSSSAVVASNKQEYATRRFFLNWLLAYLGERATENSELLRAVRRQRWQYRYPIVHRVLKHNVWGELRSLPNHRIRFGSLRRLNPVSRDFGFARGQPVDRYYIEQFLATHAADIRGHVLEVEDSTYTRQFGGTRVTQSDVLHVREGEPKATLIADLTQAGHIQSDTFDCIILTQTLQFIFDLRAAVASVHRILKPGGVVLATVPGISQISRYDMERWGHYWSFTTQSVQRLLGEVFGSANVQVETRGNVLTAISFLHGLASRELDRNELDQSDPDYQLIITARAVKQ